MGYTTRDVLPISPTVKTAKTALDLFMEQHPVPAHIHEPFSAWIERNKRAKFDCFSPPNWSCICYKCVNWQANKEFEIAMFEAIKDETENMALVSNLDAPDAYSRFHSVSQSPNMTCVFKTSKDTVPNTVPNLENQEFKATVSQVSHFYTNFDMNRPEAPQTPKMSTVNCDYDSDHGKAEAQLKWAQLMQKTPTKLRF